MKEKKLMTTVRKKLTFAENNLAEDDLKPIHEALRKLNDVINEKLKLILK